MSEANFTPGPWAVRRDEFIEANTPKGHPYYGRIPRTEILESDSYPTKLADLHLCAAAPELYEALNRFAKWFDSEHAASHEMLLENMEVTLAALKKARGES